MLVSGSSTYSEELFGILVLSQVLMVMCCKIYSAFCLHVVGSCDVLKAHGLCSSYVQYSILCILLQTSFPLSELTFPLLNQWITIDLTEWDIRGVCMCDMC